MNLRKTLLKDWPIMLVILLPFVLIAYFWEQIPDKIGMHWGISGEVDRYADKGWEAFFLPLMSIGTYFLLVFVPVIDPKKKTDNRQKALRAFRSFIPIFLSLISIVMLFQWLGYDFSVLGVTYLGISCLFLLFGNYMHTIKPNYFIGIRTPWTLESEENWRKTHQMGSKLWVVGSLIMILLWFALDDSGLGYALFAGILILTITTVGYSFYLYLKERENTQTSDTVE